MVENAKNTEVVLKEGGGDWYWTNKKSRILPNITNTKTKKNNLKEYLL